MYHPTTRVLTILELLQAHASQSGAELAARLEVDRRTVRRYITMLQDLGIPIEASYGRYGGYRLRPGFKLPPLMLSDDEALAVTLSLLAARRQGLPGDPLALEGALAKIERVLPAGLRARLQAVAAVVAFQPATPTPQPEGAVIMRLSTAAQQSRRVLLRYHGRAETTARELDPYGLVCHWDRWYVVGWCHLREEVRVFRLDRIGAAELTEQTFSPPPGFDSLRYVLDSLATLPWGWEAEVLLETTLEWARQQFPPGYALLDEEPGGVRLRAHVDRLDWMACQLVMLGCPFVVRRPAELRQALRELSATVAALAEREEASAPQEAGGRSQEPGARSQEPGARS